MEHLRNKALKKFHILKHLASVRWNCDRETLITTYKLYIQLIIGYCHEILNLKLVHLPNYLYGGTIIMICLEI